MVHANSCGAWADREGAREHKPRAKAAAAAAEQHSDQGSVAQSARPPKKPPEGTQPIVDRHQDHALGRQIPAVVGGRAIDAVTGRRSKVNTFIRKNRKKAGLDDPTGPKVEGRTAALRAAAQQQAAATAALAEAINSAAGKTEVKIS